MSEVVSRPVAKAEDGIRLDRWFKRHFPQVTHGRLEKLLRTGQIRVDGQRAKSNDRLAPGQIIRVPPIADNKRAHGREQKLSDKDRSFVQGLVLREEENFFVLNKPAGLAVQGGSKTLRHLDGLLPALARTGDERPRLVHRLDRDTSGAIIVARNAAAAADLAKLFRTRAVVKIYWALTSGVPIPRSGTIDLPLAKEGGRGSERMEVQDEEGEGQRAITRFEVISSVGRQFAWVALLPITGRTHQLRAHLAAIGTPILGDPKYGLPDAQPEGAGEGLHLHSRRIALPASRGRRLVVDAPLPAHMAKSWKLFGFELGEAAEAMSTLERE